jgi:GNAT superfamily N-acetyltransferase
MAKAFHAASGLPIPFSSVMADAMFRATLDDRDKVCLLYVVDDVPRGILAAHAGLHHFTPIKIAQEIIWWVDPDYRGSSALKMLSAYEEWARERGCVFAGMVGLGADPAPSALYQRRGYEPTERHFLKLL